MTTQLTTTLKREIDIEGDKYTLTLDPEGLKIVPKGKRKGVDLTWKSIVGGDAALSTALSASLYRTRAAAPSLRDFKPTGLKH